MDEVRTRHERRLAALKRERNSYEALWQEQNDWIVPGRFRNNDKPDNRGKKNNLNIVDNTALLSHRVARSGMQAGLTSPTRPWMRYSTIDRDLKEYGPVKDYLYVATERARAKLASSNVYNALHAGYGDQLLFGQFCLLLSRDKLNKVKADMLVTGQYWLAQSNPIMVDTCYRRVWMTVEQIVGRFVAKEGGKMDWSNVSNSVKNCWDRAAYDDWVEVFHAIEPRHDRNPNGMGKADKPFLSNYWEAGGPDKKMLEISGFDRNPILAPRWDIIGSDVYADTCPGKDALSDTKMLQKEQVWKGTGIEQMVKPTIVAPTSLRNAAGGKAPIPGQMIYIDENTGGQTYRRAFDVTMSLGDLGNDIVDIRNRIDRAFYADLFQAISRMEGVQPRNALELTQRKEEQLQQLGPTVERQHHELIQPLAAWLYHAVEEDGDLPPLPEELANQDLKIENISTLAQAQLAVQTGPIERLMTYVGSIAGANQESIDKIDFDQSIDEYADYVGVVPTIIRSDDEVASLRQQRQQAMAAQQNAELAAQVAPAVKDGAQAAAVLQDVSQTNQGPVDLLSRLGISG